MRINWKRLGLFALVAAAIWWVFTEPASAASFVSDDVIGTLKQAATSLRTFATTLIS